ncbi:MAG: PadR family transcriptional regulator [Geodermatophilaceae bacterium]|nr:PadR family transcriptional regulator [Geodermatophilaceae bacterium]
MLEMAILGLLNEAPMHGYELRKRVLAVFGGFRALSYGSLYPALKRMREQGWICGQDPDDASRVLPADAPPLTGKRGKVVYALTAEGKERFQELLTEGGPEAWEDERFGVRFAFFAQTDADVRMRILEGRRRRVEERRDGLRSSLARTRQRVDRYTLELQSHGLDSIDREVRWLSELIDHETVDRRQIDGTNSQPPKSTT